MNVRMVCIARGEPLDGLSIGRLGQSLNQDVGCAYGLSEDRRAERWLEGLVFSRSGRLLWGLRHHEADGCGRFSLCVQWFLRE